MQTTRSDRWVAGFSAAAGMLNLLDDSDPVGIWVGLMFFAQAGWLLAPAGTRLRFALLVAAGTCACIAAVYGSS